MTGPSYWRRRDSTTSLRFSAHCRRDLSRFRFRFRWVAPAMSVLVRCCATHRRLSFSRRPLSWALSPSMLRRSRTYPAPSVVEVDLLDLDSRHGSGARRENHAGTAYLQYTSGSTRQPAGVMVTHQNIMANFEQLISDTFEDHGKVPPPDTTVVSWLPFYHDMGLMLGICLPILAGLRAVLTSPVAFLQKPARWMQLVARNSRTYTAGPNFAFELAARNEPPTRTWRGSTWGRPHIRLRCRTGPRGDDQAFHRAVRPLQPSATPRCGRVMASRRRRCT